MDIEEIKAMSIEGETQYTHKDSSSLSNPSKNPTPAEILQKSRDFIIGGIASTSAIDLENEKITRKALEKIWEHLCSLDEVHRNLCVGHSSTQVGTVLLEYGNRKSGLIDEGLYLICKVRQDIPIALDTIKKIESGELQSFSIKIGIPEELTENIKTVCNKDQCWKELRSAYFIELSLTDSPANPDCEDTVKILS
jgi:hypothetical protein